MSPLSPDFTAGLELVLLNLLAWSLQLALVAGAAAVLTRILPLESPGPRLGLWQSLLALGLLLPLVQPWRVPVAATGWSLAFAPEGAAALALTAGEGSQIARGVPWALIVGLVLVGGAALQLGRLGLGLVRVRRLRLTARALDPPPWLDELRARIAPSARFVTSDRCGGPATFGVARPVIVLPSGLERMPPERQRAVALHELIHARRRDWLVLVGEELVKAVLFFHPAVHWIVGRIRLAREQCVDAEVVRSLGGRQAYLESLVEVARLTARTEAVPAAPFLREHHLRERVELLLKEVPMSRIRSWPQAGVVAGALVLAGAVAVAAFPMVGPAANGQDTATPAAAADPKPAPFPAKKISHVNPVYPKDAKEEGVQGIFLLEVKIGTEGQITDAQVVASTPATEYPDGLLEKRGTPGALAGDARLGAAAVEAVRQWRYEPVLGGDGQPKAVDAILTVKFVLS